MERSSLGYAVVTFNQASHQPEFDYSDIHSDMESAIAERDHKRAETAKVGRREHHAIAEIIELEEGGSDG